jgi:hypothetical protein
LSDLPVACTLGPDALSARRQGLLAELAGRAAAHQELPDGHRLSFENTDGNLELLFRMVAAERRCCEFLRFQITVEPGGGAVTLDLTGPPGTREFVAALFER